MYQNTPTPKNTLAKTYALITLVGGIVLFISANYIQYYFPWLVQCFGVVLIGASIYLATAFLLRRYTYSVEDSEKEDEDGEMMPTYLFRITEFKNNRNITLCLVEVRDIKLCRTVTPENRKKVKSERKTKKRYTYDIAFAAPKQLELQMHVDDEDISMLITYDPELVGVFNKLGVRVE